MPKFSKKELIALISEEVKGKLPNIPEEKKEVHYFNTEKVFLRGLGSQEAVEGLKSTNNVLEFGSMKYRNHMFYIVLDPEFNLSSHIGIPVNGIIGFQFFIVDYLFR